MRVLVYNTDGVNAYAAEVASLVAATGARVTVLDAVNGEHRPAPGVRWRRTLPANYGGRGSLGQVLRLLRAVAAVTCAVGARGDALLVCWSRFAVEQLLFAVLARLGRPVVYVLHNPGPREPDRGLSGVAHRSLLHAAKAVVVHAERLVADVRPDVRPRVRVCGHPPYLQTVTRASSTPLPLPPDRQWTAFIGTLRPDKGVGELPEILALLDDATLRRTGLVVCGRGELAEAQWRPLRARGLALVDETSLQPVPQRRMLEVLAAGPLVLAPYVGATQSGTVIFALSAGCRVLAYDKGGIRDVLSDEGLVPAGDAAAFAAALADGRGGGAREPLPAWAKSCGSAWAAVCADAQRGTAPRRRV